jgi:hypothetical protein
MNRGSINDSKLSGIKQDDIESEVRGEKQSESQSRHDSNSGKNNEEDFR